MKWSGANLKNLCEQQGIAISALAKHLEVSRRTVYDWIGGQVPKGNHLLALCRFLSIDPEVLFGKTTSPALVPTHRTRKRALVNQDRQELATELAEEYAVVCEGLRLPVIQPVVRVADNNAAEALAISFREIAGLSDTMPMTYNQVFRLLEKLGICVVFRTFPMELKDYAFYTRIWGHRVVFVNLLNNVLDTIFPIIHEAVHAVRDEKNPSDSGYDENEELFCDCVANLTQFPPDYINQVYSGMKKLATAAKVNWLKSMAAMHRHAIYGLVKSMERSCGTVGLSPSAVHGADSNLHKDFPLLRDVLCEGIETPSDYAEHLQRLSPLFFDALCMNGPSLSVRKLAELLELPSVIDAQELRDFLAKKQRS
jgi:transcriptional regulator with XRE-family HTH domain